MLVPKGRDVLIEQKPALKLWPTIKLKRHRPMFVVCTLALKCCRFLMINVCGIWLLWLEQGLTLVEGTGCPCWWYWEVCDDDILNVLSILLCWLLVGVFILVDCRSNHFFWWGSVRVVSRMDFCVSCALMIRYEGRVYMSHGRWLSLPGPHDTVDIDDGPSIDPWACGPSGPDGC